MEAITAGRLIADARARSALSQHALAERAGTSQSAVARLEAGGVQPSLDTLQRLLAAAGFTLRFELSPAPVADPLVDAFKRDVDRTLLRENLRRPVDERLRSMAEHLEFGRALEGAVRARHAHK